MRATTSFLYHFLVSALAMTSLLIRPAAAKLESPAKHLVITIVTAKLKHFLAYPGSTLNPAVRADVYFEGAGCDTTPKTLYKSLWFGGDDVCIGSQRKATLPQDKNEPIEIHISADEPEEQESLAAASAALRLYLEFQMRNQYAGTIYATTNGFDQFRSAKEQKSFRTYSAANGSIGSVNIRLMSEDQNKRLGLTYAPN